MIRMLGLFLLTACGGGPETECSTNALIPVFRDEDDDGHGDPNAETTACEVKVGFASTGLDCDDTRSNVNPDAVEDCDGLDNDCDFETDEGLRLIEFYADADGDTYGDRTAVEIACAPSDGYVANPYDCNDADAQSFPGGQEFCDGGDNDCDGLTDDEDPDVNRDSMPYWYADRDLDTYGSQVEAIQACAKPEFPQIVIVDNDLDCDDTDPAQHPGAGEVCNGEDDDCDGQLDDSDADLDRDTLNTYFRDDDGDGYGVDTGPQDQIQACDAPWFYADNADDCDDSDARLKTEGNTYFFPDQDADGYGDPEGDRFGPTCDAGPYYAPVPLPPFDLAKVDCDDQNELRNPGELEVCDDIDNDCDLLVDDADDSIDETTMHEWYTDRDADTWGDDNTLIVTCVLVEGAVERGGDCDDLLPEVNPDAQEVCNFGIDDDCNGLADQADPGFDPDSALLWYQDYDGDGFGNPNIGLYACEKPDGYVENGLDCNDDDPNLGDVTDWIPDNDGDGVGRGTPDPEDLGCEPPGPNYARDDAGQDCDDNDPDRFPGNPEQCLNGVDEDCDDDDCDTCGNAESGKALDHLGSPYTLSGDLDGWDDGLTLPAGNSCTDSQTRGGEGFVPVELRNGDQIVVTYRNDGDGVAYLVDDCNQIPVECRNGGDLEPQGQTEYLSYLNNTDSTERLYLVLDCSGDPNQCGSFDANVEISRADPYLPDSCAEVAGFPPFETGSYALGGSLDGWSNNLQLPDTGCTGSETEGGEAIVPVHLKNNERVRVSYRQLSGDASLFLLPECDDIYGMSCIEGVDAFINGQEEVLEYQNTSGGPVDLLVALDCYNDVTCQTFQADMVISP